MKEPRRTRRQVFKLRNFLSLNLSYISLHRAAGCMYESVPFLFFLSYNLFHSFFLSFHPFLSSFSTSPFFHCSPLLRQSSFYYHTFSAFILSNVEPILFTQSQRISELQPLKILSSFFKAIFSSSLSLH